MTRLRITVGPFVYTARMEEADAPKTCAEFKKLLPYRHNVIQARCRGQGGIAGSLTAES